MKDGNNNTCTFEPTKTSDCSELEKIPKDETLRLRKKHIGLVTAAHFFGETFVPRKLTLTKTLLVSPANRSPCSSSRRH